MRLKYTDSKGVKQAIEATAIVSIDADGNEVTTPSGEPAVLVVVSDGAGADNVNDVLKTEQIYPYEMVQASAIKQVLGVTGAVGDYIHTITYALVGTSNFVLYDDTTVIVAFTGTAGEDNTGTIILDTVSQNGAWNITTGSSSRALATGRFT